MFTRTQIIAAVSYTLVAIGLVVVLLKGLLSALLAGLLVFSLVHRLTPFLGRRISGARGRMVTVALLAATIIALLWLGIYEAIEFFRSEAGSMQNLLQRLADIIENSRHQIPAWLSPYIPYTADALRDAITSWLREHALEAKTVGGEIGRMLAHILIGMLIGALVALYDITPHSYRPLSLALHDRITKLRQAFQQIVFAQFRISLINAFLTGLYILVVLPLNGIRLPLAKTMVALTFVVGLLPVIGNLISNSVMVVIGLSHSLKTALVSLLFLVAIHKLEYFLNARIIGTHINARTWELLTAMLVMEAIFGLPGVVAAPIFYAFLKKELVQAGLV
ncbi:MAG: AI-2E family transporter [Burkholderiaceae bacterium]|jgi:predicted PurR-regulated permease PerM